MEGSAHGVTAGGMRAFCVVGRLVLAELRFDHWRQGRLVPGLGGALVFVPGGELALWAVRVCLSS